MAFLVIAGTTIAVKVDSATRKAPERIGSTVRAFAGNMRTTVRVEKRSWQVTTKHLSDADAATIEALVDNGDIVTCSGDLLGGSVDCQVTVGDSPYTATGTTFKRQLTLTLVEV